MIQHKTQADTQSTPGLPNNFTAPTSSAVDL